MDGKEVSKSLVLLYWWNFLETHPLELSRNPLTKMPEKAVYGVSCQKHAATKPFEVVLEKAAGCQVLLTAVRYRWQVLEKLPTLQEPGGRQAICTEISRLWRSHSHHSRWSIWRSCTCCRSLLRGIHWNQEEKPLPAVVSLSTYH